MKKPLYMQYQYRKQWQKRQEITNFVDGLFLSLMIISFLLLLSGEWEYIIALFVIPKVASWFTKYCEQLENKYTIWEKQKNHQDKNTKKAITKMKFNNINRIGWNLK